MNIEWFSRWPGQVGAALPAGVPVADHVAGWLILVFVQGKFWLMFSLLFGAGFAVMQSRAEAAGTPFAWPYLRRAALLLVLGVAHAVLLWVGDILHTYALAALGLLLFARVGPIGRGVAGGMVFGAVTLGIAASASMYLLNPDLGAGLPTADPELVAAGMKASAIYAHGDFAAVTAQRLRDFTDALDTNFFLVPIALSVFLLGSALLGGGPLAKPEAHRGFHRAMAFGALPLGIALEAWAATLSTGVGAEPTDAEMLAQALAWTGAPLMTIGYIGVLALASLHPRLGPWLRDWLAPSGRMALTNYLMASVVLSTLFYGYGFGLYGQVSRVGQVGIVLALLVVQVLMSRWWLARHRYGPLEWVWRWFTWWRRPAPVAAHP